MHMLVCFILFAMLDVYKMVTASFGWIYTLMDGFRVICLLLKILKKG